LRTIRRLRAGKGRIIGGEPEMAQDGYQVTYCWYLLQACGFYCEGNAKPL
jgi:hypothetical protein